MRCAAALLFIYGAWLRWSDSFVAITTPDSFQYLQGALTGDLSTVAWRTFPYPLFIKVCIEHGGGLETVVALQKAGGLLTALLVFGTWIQFKKIIPYRRWGNMAHDLLGLLLFAMLLLPYGSTRFHEQSIMLEALSSLALALVVFSAARLFTVLRQKSSHLQVALWAGTLLGLSLFANQFNPRFSPTVVLSFLFVVIALRVARVRWTVSLAAITVPIILAVIFLFRIQAPLDRKNIWNSTFVSMHLLFMNVRIILPEITSDAEDTSFTRYDRVFLRQLSSAITDELTRASREGPGGNYTLNYDPNRLLWGPANDLLRSNVHGSPSAYNAFCQYYFRRGLSAHPIGYLHKVALEWWYLLRPSGPVLDDSWSPLPLTAALGDSALNAVTYAHRARPAVQPAFLAYQVQLAASRDSTVTFSTPFPLNHLGMWVNRFFLIGWVLSGGFAAYCLWRKVPNMTEISLGFIGISILLLGQFAPLALVTTTCGARAIQGLRVLTAFTTVNIGLIVLLLLVTLTGQKHRFWGKPEEGR